MRAVPNHTHRYVENVAFFLRVYAPPTFSRDTHAHIHAHSRIMQPSPAEKSKAPLEGTEERGEREAGLKLHSSRVSHTGSGRTAPLSTGRLLHGGSLEVTS